MNMMLTQNNLIHQKIAPEMQVIKPHYLNNTSIETNSYITDNTIFRKSITMRLIKG